MVNLIVYLEKGHDAQELVDQLLKEKLIANASIDENNHSYKLLNNEVVSSINTVVTLQTKSMLFHEIENFVHEKYNASIPIYSVPIINSNSAFEDFIRKNTKSI